VSGGRALNPHLLDTGTPPIPAARAWLAGYDGRAGAPIDLSQAAPGDPPHPAILDALARAAADPATALYGPIAGEPALRAAYATHLSDVYGAAIAPEASVITTGCNQAFMVAVLALARAGDDVLLPAPWYFNHHMALSMLGIGALPLPCRPAAGMLPDPDEAARLITVRTRALVLVTPSNPTGAVMPPALIRRFCDLARRHGLWLILDETYRDFLPAGQARPHDLAAEAGGWPDGVISLTSFSKSHCLPGYRLGALTAPVSIQPEIAKVLDTVQICAPRIGQIALGETLAELGDWRAANRQRINARAAAFRAAMAVLNGFAIDAIGAYFAYLRVPPGVSGSAIARRLATETGVLVLPGAFFGDPADAHVRVAFANADAALFPEVARRLAQIAAP
jgi:aspartate/methionine/tyrosine aminotransferase